MRLLSILIGAIGFLVALLLGRRGRLREDLDWETVEKPGRLAEIDGYRVHFVEAGAGPPIVLIHGFGGHAYHYRRMAQILARNHRVIAVDLKGFGYSERDARTGLSHTDQIMMLKKLLARLGVARAVFVGHSAGGLVVMRYAATYPDAVEAAVLVASVTGDEAYNRMRPAPRFIARPLMPVLGKLVASQLVRAAFHDPAYGTAGLRDEYLRPGRIRGSMDGLYAMMRARRSDRPIDFSKIGMPVLLINGVQDRVVPLKSAQKIRTHIPQARLVAIDHAKHGLIDERAPECARAILDFLAEAGVGEKGAEAARA